MWIYPGGHMEEDENPLGCAVREAKEETGASFMILPNSDVSIDAGFTKSLPRPLIIMDEEVPYKDGHHQHFDMIYLGIAESMEFHRNDESSDCNWFNREEIADLKTYDNVREIIKYGFDTFQGILGQ